LWLWLYYCAYLLSKNPITKPCLIIHINMPPKTTPVVSVPSYAELLSSSRKTSKKGVVTEKKKKKTVLEEKKTETQRATQVKASTPEPQTSSTDPAPEVVNGCRVVLASSGLFGTVKYVGEALFQSGVWVGIELDSEQGKNDGVVKGHRYFSCPQNHGIFVRPTSFDIISFPSSMNQQTTNSTPPTETTATTVSNMPPQQNTQMTTPQVKSAASSEDGDTPASSVTSSNPVTSAPTTSSASSVTSSTSSYASFVSKSQAVPGRKSANASPVGGMSANSSPRRSSNDLYSNNLIGSDSDRTSPARSSTSAARSYDGGSGSGGGRRLSPRRRTSALVSSIDDVLASMEFAASDINKKTDGKPSTLKKKKSSNNLTNRPKSPFERQGSQSRPKSPFDRGGMGGSNSVYSSEEERMFVENLVELVAKSPVVSDYLKTEIEKHQKSAVVDTASKSEVAILQDRIYELESNNMGSVGGDNQNPGHSSSDLESLVDRHATHTQQSIEALTLRIQTLEEAVAVPVKALNRQLVDLDLAISGLSNGADGNDKEQSMAHCRSTLTSVRALALQAFNALEVSH